MKIKARHAAIGLMTMVSLASFAGLISGTVAWYANVTRVTVEYSGTAVSQAEQLQIGLICDQDFTKDGQGDPIPNIGIVSKEVINEVHYYWAAPGVGLSSTAINAYLQARGYATYTLEPVTTREYATGGSFSLWKAPIARHTEFFAAANKAYCKINMAFRVLNASSEPQGDKDVWLTDATVQAGNPGEKIREALRMYINKSGLAAQSFILNPTADASGSDAVGGILNLESVSDYYDYDPDTNREILYGDYTDAPDYTHYNADSELDDFNATGENTASTFLAKHKAGIDGYDSSDANDFVAKRTQYLSLADIAPEDHDGSLSGGVPLCHTDENTKVGNVEMTIYLEGWDHSVINNEMGNDFNLGLQFQIDRA